MKKVILELFSGGQDGRHTQEMAQVPKVVVDTLKKLYLNEKYNDIRFQCHEDDGTTVMVHAHKNVLATSSPYFENMFSGKWLEASQEVI